MSSCNTCHYSHVCSDQRKKRHKGNCGDYYEEMAGAFYPGGSPPLKFCPICKHVEDKCVSDSDIMCYALNHGCDKDDLKNALLKEGYVLTDYHILEGQCMTYCNRFEEAE